MMRILRKNEAVEQIHRIQAFTTSLLSFKLQAGYWRYDNDDLQFLPGKKGGTENASLSYNALNGLRFTHIKMQ